MDRSDRRRPLRSASVLAIALSALPADGAERVRLQDNYDKALKEIWPASAPPIGSGFHVAPGKVVTAAHVIAGCHVLWVRSSATSSTSAQTIAIDTRSDIALLDVPGLYALPTIAIGETEVGDEVRAFGFPKRRGAVVRERASTAATVEGSATSDTGGALMTLRGSASEGMSGGPVVDARGLVVGMTLARRDDTQLIAVTASGLRRFLAYLAIATRPPLPIPPPVPGGDDAGTNPHPLTREQRRSHERSTPPRRSESNMPQWTGAVMQVGCSR